MRVDKGGGGDGSEPRDATGAGLRRLANIYRGRGLAREQHVGVLD